MPKKAKPKASATGTPQRIIQAATELFLHTGYSNTSLEDVAEAAGVTKPTVYSHFGSKEGLLTAITKVHASANAEMMSASLIATGDVRDDLTRFGEVFMKRVMGEEAGCWQRLAMTESVDHPEIGQVLFAAGPARVIAAVTNYIAGEVKAKRLTCTNAEAAAEQFLGMMIGLQPIRRMTGQKPPTKAKQMRICVDAVETFLSAYGVKQ